MDNAEIAERIADLIHQSFKHGRGVQDISGIMTAETHDTIEELLGKVRLWR